MEYRPMTRRKLKEIIHRLGPTVTFEDAQRVLKEENNGWGTIKRIFQRTYDQVYPHEALGKGNPTMVKAEKEPHKITAADLLAVHGPKAPLEKTVNLIKLMSAVEAVGGIANARHYLDVIENIGGTL